MHKGITSAGGRSIAPTSDDVLFGRGKRFQNHPGNLRMRKIIRKYKKIYSVQKGQHKKRLVVENAYNEITSGGARFIKQSEENKNEWVEVMMHEALEKVAHTIRYKPRNAKDGTTSNQEDEDDESSADEQPVNMAANTVVLSRDQPASSLVPSASAQIQASAEPVPSPMPYGSQMASGNNFNPLLNQGFAQQQANQIVPPISLLDVYVNPINRPFLQGGLFSSSYPQNLLMGGFGNNSYGGFNQVSQNVNLAALRQINQATTASQQAMMLAQLQQQQSAQDDANQSKPKGKDSQDYVYNAKAEQDKLNQK